MKRIPIVFALVALLAVCALAQNSTTATDQSSLADYARKVRKDAPSKTKPKVYDNDNLPTDDKLSVVGAPATADAQNNAAKPGDDGQAKNDQSKKDQEWKDWQDKMTTQKGEIDLASRELDVLQKEYQLRAAAMYADAGNRLRNSGDWDKQDADYKQKIADKQKAVDDAKQKLDEMQEQARKDGVPTSVREQTAPSSSSEQ
jgi:HAMP domain-containing protein